MAAAVDPVTLGKRYQEQLGQTADLLKQRANETQANLAELKSQLDAQREQLQPQATAMLDNYMNSIKDLDSPVPAEAPPFLLRTYLWSGVCLLMEGVARRISGMFLYGVIGMIFDTWVAMTLAYVAFPVFVYMSLRKIQMSEMEQEQTVLFASVAEGILTGALVSNRYVLFYTPPKFLLALAMGLVAHSVGSKEQIMQNRRMFLAAVLGGGAIGFVAFGLAINFNLSYMVAMTILLGAAFVDLQLKLATIPRNETTPQLEQWKTIMTLITAGAVAHLIFSTTKTDRNGSVVAAVEEKMK